MAAPKNAHWFVSHRPTLRYSRPGDVSRVIMSSVATANLVGITGIARRLVQDGAMDEASARTAMAKQWGQVQFVDARIPGPGTPRLFFARHGAGTATCRSRKAKVGSASHAAGPALKSASAKTTGAPCTVSTANPVGVTGICGHYLMSRTLL